MLGVSRVAALNEIKDGYRSAAIKVHPDKVPAEQRAEAEVKFKLLGEAHDVLSNNDKRELYDKGCELIPVNVSSFTGMICLIVIPPFFLNVRIIIVHKRTFTDDLKMIKEEMEMRERRRQQQAGGPGCGGCGPSGCGGCG